MTRPFLGAPAEPGTDCVYAPDIDAPRCTNLAVLHVVIADPGWYQNGEHTSVRTCADHAPYAYAIPNVLAEHAFTPACADPRSTLAVNGSASHCFIGQPA